jgi:hypothetical protein
MFYFYQNTNSNNLTLQKKTLITPNKNRVFLLSEKAGCHASRPVPIGVLKCAEVALGLAIIRGVAFHFDDKSSPY